MKLSFDILPQFICFSSREFYPGEHHIDRCINESVLLLMKSGVLNFEEDGVPVSIKKGEYYIQRPLIHQTGKEVSLSPNYYYIHFFGEYDEIGLPLRGTFDMELIKKYIDELLVIWQDAPKMELNNNLYCILSALSKSESEKDTPAHDIKIYIIKNYNKSITLDNLCKQFNFSKNHLIRIFKQQYGKTPYQFLIEYQLEQARQLLLTTTRSCSQIAFFVGFEDYSVFYRAFTKRFKTPPTRYVQLRHFSKKQNE